MDSSFYQAELIHRAKHPRFQGELPGATHTGTGINASCGDEVSLFLQVHEGVIQAARHQGRSCSICTVASDQLCEVLEGVRTDQVEELSSTHHCLERLGITLSPTRTKCAILAAEVLHQIDL